MSAANTILLVGKISHARAEWEALGSLAQLKEYEDGTREDFIARCQNGEFDGVVGMYRSNESTSVTGPFDEELVAALPKSLKYITHNGAGYDNIDVAAVSQRGIQVSSTPIAVDEATADVAMFLILGALRRITTPFLAIRNGTWRGGPAFTLGRDPRGKTLGILGMGGIGRALAHRARAFGMHIQYHNRHRLPTSREHGAVYVPFDTLLRTSDVLSLNLALNASTRHIVGAAELARMPDGAVLVNTARGPVVDEAALVDALRRGKLAAVGLDVFEHEPHVHPGLLEHPHAVLLPHVGTATVETQKAMEVLVLDNLRSAVEGKGLLTQIPEQKPRGPSM